MHACIRVVVVVAIRTGQTASKCDVGYFVVILAAWLWLVFFFFVTSGR
jgi:hypothetical protein